MNMIDHITLRVSNIEKAATFYNEVLSHVGYSRLSGEFDGAICFTVDNGSDIWIYQDDTPSQNVHMCFVVESKETVEEFHTSGIAAGGIDNGKPGIRLEYGEDYYAAFIYDLDGNNIEAVFRG